MFELQVCPLLFLLIVLNDIILVSESIISNTTRVVLLIGKVFFDRYAYWARMTACPSRQHFSLQMETWFLFLMQSLVLCDFSIHPSDSPTHELVCIFLCQVPRLREYNYYETRKSHLFS